MDERADRGEFYPGGRTTPEGGGTDTDKVDRVNLGEVGESYTLKTVKQKVDQIVRAMAPAAVCIALAVVRLMSYAATAPLEDIPNTAPVVTNEEDVVAIAAVGALGAAVSNRVEAAVAGVDARMDSATNETLRAALGAVAAESNRVDSTFAKRSEIPLAPDLSPYALKSELPSDYLRERDVTNFASRAWIQAQGYATAAGVSARIDAQDLAIDAATNAMWAAQLEARARMVAATNAIDAAWRSGTNETMRAVLAASNELARADARLDAKIDEIRILAADSNAVTRLVTEDGATWQDATGTVWQVEDTLGRWTASTGSVEFVSWQHDEMGWHIVFTVDGTNSSAYTDNPTALTNYTVRGDVWSFDYPYSGGGGWDIYFARPVLRGGVTNVVDRVLYESSGGADVLAAATNYTDQVADEFEDGTRIAQEARYAGSSGYSDYSFTLSGKAAVWYDADDLIAESTNAAVAVAAAATNALDRAIRADFPSGTPEWRVEYGAVYDVHYVTNGALYADAAGYDSIGASLNGWPEYAAMFVKVSGLGYPYTVPGNVRLVGYGTWPTTNQFNDVTFQSVWWRSGTNLFVNILVEE